MAQIVTHNIRNLTDQKKNSLGFQKHNFHKNNFSGVVLAHQTPVFPLKQRCNKMTQKQLNHEGVEASEQGTLSLLAVTTVTH